MECKIISDRFEGQIPTPLTWAVELRDTRCLILHTVHTVYEVKVPYTGGEKYFDHELTILMTETF